MTPPMGSPANQTLGSLESVTVVEMVIFIVTNDMHSFSKPKVTSDLQPPPPPPPPPQLALAPAPASAAPPLQTVGDPRPGSALNPNPSLRLAICSCGCVEEAVRSSRACSAEPWCGSSEERPLGPALVDKVVEACSVADWNFGANSLTPPPSLVA